MKIHDEKLTYGRTCVYNLNYHIVWGTKYRNKVITEQIKKDLKSLLYQIAEEKVYRLSISRSVWTTCASACVRPAEVVDDNNRLLPERNIGFQTFPYAPGIQIFLLEKEDRHLWSPSHYVESIGVSNQQAVVKYIDDQRKKEASHDKD